MPLVYTCFFGIETHVKCILVYDSEYDAVSEYEPDIDVANSTNFADAFSDGFLIDFRVYVFL